MPRHPAPPTRLPRPWIAIATIGLFLWLDHFHLDLFRQLAGDWRGYPRLAALAVLGYGPQLLAALGFAALLRGPRRAPDALGLDRPPLPALAFGLAATAILPLGFALSAGFAPPERALLEVLRTALLPGFGEELLYRAFLFGILFRFAGWGFLPAALVGASLFAAAHLYQSDDAAEAAAIFALTGVGALWFAWLYAEWDYNLWVPVAFHTLMNMYWTLFAVSDTALGSAAANGLRLGVIGLSVAVTLRMRRRRGGRIVHGRRWWRGDAHG